MANNSVLFSKFKQRPAIIQSLRARQAPTKIISLLNPPKLAVHHVVNQ